MKKNYFRHYGSTLQEQARDLRQHMTEPERKLWFCFLREQKPRFSCQKVIGQYILDFYCSELRLAIELDGGSHTETVEHDLDREKYLTGQGIEVLHVTNQEVHCQFDAVCEWILSKISCAQLQRDDRDHNEATPHLASQGTPLRGGTRKGNLPMKTVTIYTDGACSGNPGPGGWGAILSYNGVEKELSGGEAQTTNNRMELTAVITALAALKEPCVVELYSDSKYVIDALEKGWVYGWKKKGWIKSDKKPALNVDLWEQLLPLVAKHTVHYHWVKGHAENEKNNRCDEMAVAESRKFK